MAKVRPSHFAHSSNPFITRGDPLSAEDIASTFIVPDKWFARLQDPFHHIIEGNLGSGKTMVLRAMSAPVRAAVQALNQKMLSHIYRSSYIGVYISFSSKHTSIFRQEQDDSRLQALFMLWLNARIAQELLGALAVMLGDDWRTISQKEPQEIFSLLLAELRVPLVHTPSGALTLSDAGRTLESIANDVRKSITVDGNVSFAYASAPIREAVEQPRLPEDYLTSAIRILQDSMPGVTALLPVYVLFDYCEELPESLQRVVNGFFCWQEGQAFFTKACFLPGGLRTNRTVSGRELVRPDEVRDMRIEWDWLSDEYLLFCQKVASGHLARFRALHPDLSVSSSLEEFLGVSDPLDELARVTGDADKELARDRVRTALALSGEIGAADVDRVLFHEIHRRGARKTYSSCRGLTALSSGNIRTFMTLCEMAFNIEYDRSSQDAYRTVSCESQDQAARQVAKEWMNSRIPTTTSVYEAEVKHLVQSFGRTLRALHQRSPHDCVWRALSVISRDGSPVLLSGETQEVIRSAVQAGILRRRTEADDLLVFDVPTVFAPEWDLNCTPGEHLEVDAPTIERMAAVFVPKGGRDGKGKKETLPLIADGLDTPDVFVAMPDKDETGVTFAESLIRKIVENSFGGRLVRLESSKDEMLPDAIRELIRDRVSLMFVDITRHKPNVLFEYGIAIASRVPVHAIYNTAYRKFDHRVLPEVLQGIRVIRFSSRGGKTTLEREVEDRLARWKEGRGSERMCVIKRACPFPKPETRDVVVVLGPDSDEWRRDILSHIQEVAHGAGCAAEAIPRATRPTIPPICIRCNLIRQSRFVLVDGGVGEKSMPLLLGMAFALDKNPMLLRRGGRDWEPSCWQGKKVLVFDTPEQLADALKQSVDWSK